MDFSEQQEIIDKDPQDYAFNPITAFTLIKRLTKDLDHLKDIASDFTGRSIEVTTET